MASDVRDAFAAALGPRAEPIAAWGSSLDRALQEAVRALPKLPPPDAGFGAHLATRIPAEAEPGPALAALDVPDLYLAYWCARGDAKALAEFEHRYGRELDRALRRARNAGADPEDLRQRLYERLLVAAEGEEPRILGYAGRGALRGWLRITTTRLVINAARDHGRQPVSRADDDDELLGRILVARAEDDPELGYLKAHHREALTRALADAFDSLGPRDRNVLRYSVLHQISNEQIGKFYGVHRATAFRWRQDAQRALVGAVRASLRTRLQLDRAELDNLLRNVESRLDLSIQRMLGREAEPEPGS
jgi:RNA polymerase sigma-70 factor (ECF subfamily)